LVEQVPAGASITGRAELRAAVGDVEVAGVLVKGVPGDAGRADIGGRVGGAVGDVGRLDAGVIGQGIA